MPESSDHRAANQSNPADPLPELLSVAVSGRVIDRNVGGNSRYARAIYNNDTRKYGYEPNILRAAGDGGRIRKISYAYHEGMRWPRSTCADLLHYPADTGPILNSKLPIIATIHGIASHHVEGVRRPVNEAIWRARVSRTAKLASHIITPSESSRADLIDVFGIPPGKVTCIPLGVDEKFSSATTNENERDELSAASIPDRYVLYVGNIEPRKNLIELAGAAALVHDATGVETIVAGAPAWDSGPIIAQLNAARGLRYIGRVSEDLLVPLMRHADVFCFPSKYEGFGLPVLEAMAVGTAVVCSRRGSLDELASGAAEIIEGIDSNEIANGLISVIQDDELRTTLQARGLERASKYSWGSAREMHGRVFRGVAGR